MQGPKSDQIMLGGKSLTGADPAANNFLPRQSILINETKLGDLIAAKTQMRNNRM